MAENPIPPVVPQLTLPVPQRTDPENFSPHMDRTLSELPGVINGINAASVYIQGAKMDVSSMQGIRDDTIQAKNDTQQIKEDAEVSLTNIANQKLGDLDAASNTKLNAMEGLKDDAENAAMSAAAYAEAAGQAAGLPEHLEGTEGKPLRRMRDGGGVHFSDEFTHFISVNKSTQLVAGERYRVDTSTGTFNLLLPVGPFIGATVFLFDAKGTWKVNPPLLKRSGKTIMGLVEDMELNVNYASLIFVFDGSDWRNIA